MERSARRSSRSSTWSRPTSSATTPRSCIALAIARLAIFKKHGQADAAQRGPPADRAARPTSSTTTSRIRILKGYLACVEHHRDEGRARTRRAPGSCCSIHSIGEHDGEFGAWAFHKKGNGGFTQVLARAAESFGAEIRLESPVDSVITKDGRATGVALKDGTEYYADTVVSALDPRRTFLELVEPRELPSTTSSRASSGSGSRAPRRRSTSPSTACRSTRRLPGRGDSSAAS